MTQPPYTDLLELRRASLPHTAAPNETTERFELSQTSGAKIFSDETTDP